MEQEYRIKELERKVEILKKSNDNHLKMKKIHHKMLIEMAKAVWKDNGELDKHLKEINYMIMEG